MQADGQRAVSGIPFAGREAKSTSVFSPQLSAAYLQPPQIPDHELLCLIGRGAYGEVWLARNAIGSLRAVKIVHRQSFARVEHFEREFKGLLKFEPISRSHDGLVDVLQIGRRDDAGYFFYVMELADDSSAECETRNAELTSGTPASTPNSALCTPHSYTPRTLRALIRADYQPSTLNPQPTTACLPPTDCIPIGLKLASALEHLHANGLVHRDIKPANIIFVNREPKLADIGLVTAIDDAHSLVGTAGYIPPEGPGTPQADLYSLGKVLYEIAFAKDRQDFPQLPPDLQSHPDYAALLELNEVILKACESDPRQRYSSAVAMSKDLALLQDGKSVTQARSRAQRWKVLKRFGLAATALALLAVALTSQDRSQYSHVPSPEAKREYELGRWYYNRLTPEDHKKAIEHLNRAVEVDSKFMQPYGELTALYVWGQPGLFANEEERIRRVKEIGDKLIALDPTLAEGHTALSWHKFLTDDWVGAEDEIVRAVKFNPKYPIARDIYTFYLSIQGRADEGRRQAERAQELDPTARTSAMVASWPFIAARQFDKAIAQLQRAIELDKNFPEAHNFLGRCYEAQSNYIPAIEAWRTYDTLVGHDPSRVAASYDALRKAYDTGGQDGYLRKYIELIRDNESLPEAEQIFFAQDIAGYYARLGENEKALDEIEEHLAEWPLRHQLKFEPMFDTLREEPRFKGFLKQVGLER